MWIEALRDVADARSGDAEPERAGHARVPGFMVANRFKLVTHRATVFAKLRVADPRERPRAAMRKGPEPPVGAAPPQVRDRSARTHEERADFRCIGERPGPQAQARAAVPPGLKTEPGGA